MKSAYSVSWFTVSDVTRFGASGIVENCWRTMWSSSCLALISLISSLRGTIFDQRSRIITTLDVLEGNKVSPVKTEFSNWIKPQNLYYYRAAHPDIALEEKHYVMQNNYNAHNIYGWNIDGCYAYNILSKLHQITMVATAYSHNVKNSTLYGRTRFGS